MDNFLSSHIYSESRIMFVQVHSTWESLVETEPQAVALDDTVHALEVR